MGTTCIGYIPKSKKAFCDALCGAGVLRSSVSKGNYYAAVYGNGITRAVVIKLNTYRGELCYKAMGEDDGPYYYDCPNSILDLLTPTQVETALEWRKKCREVAASSAGIRRISTQLKLGDTVTLNKPVRFADGKEVQEVLLIERKKRYWVGSTGLGRYQIPARLLLGAKINEEA